MKLLISAFVCFEETIELDDGVYKTEEHIIEIRSLRYEIYNTSDLQNTLNNASADMELHIEKSNLKKRRWFFNALATCNPA